MTRREVAAAVGTGVLFLAIQVGALALVQPFKAAGYQAVPNPQDPTNSVVYLVGILVATGLMLLAFRYEVDVLVRLFVVGAGTVLVYYVLSVLLPPVAVVSGASLSAALLSLGVAAALWLYPEWYVIDGAGVLMGMGAAGLFGVSFGLLPALILLVVLAAYDAISVYGTEHMLTLASGVMDLRVPVLLVVPHQLSYSFLDATADGDVPDPQAGTEAETDGGPESGNGNGNGNASAGADDAVDRETPDPGGVLSEEEEDDDGRDAFFIGLGDAVMPTIIVASAAFFLETPSLGVPGIALTLPALTAIVGTLAGLAVLLTLVSRGRAHAGLPLLNGGAIAGYLLGALLAGVPLVTALGLGPYL
jgi:presenilin-like A22 family membrane protease